MLPKFDSFLDFFNDVNASIFCVSESWLTGGIPSDTVGIANYRCYRSDRATRGGGLLMYVRDDLKSAELSLIPDLTYQSLEQLWVVVTLSSKCKLAVAVVYRSGDVSVQCLGDLDRMIRFIQLNITHSIVVTGDFNIDTMHGALPHTKLGNLLNDLSLIQLIDKPTRVTDCSESCIDLVIADTELPVVCADVIECALSDHFATSCFLDFSLPSDTPRRVLVRDFKHLDDAAFDSDLARIDWGLMYLLENIDDKVNFFNTSITDLFDKHAPYILLQISATRRSKPWFTDTLRLMRRSKINAFNRYKHSRQESHRRFYCDLRNYYNFAVRVEKKLYFQQTISDSIHDPRKLWGHLKKSLPDGLGGKFVTPAGGCGFDANAFNDYFLQAISETMGDTNHTPQSDIRFGQDAEAQFSYRPVLPDKIAGLIFKQKPSAVGSDLVSARMLQRSSHVCVAPLTHIINVSFEQGIVPSSWKTSVCVPIPKNVTLVLWPTSGILASNVYSLRLLKLSCMSRWLSLLMEFYLISSRLLEGVTVPLLSVFRCLMIYSWSVIGVVQRHWSC